MIYILVIFINKYTKDMDDQEIIKYITDNKGKIKRGLTKKKYYEKLNIINVYNEIINKTKHINDISLRERIFIIHNNLYNYIPCCSVCGVKAKFDIFKLKYLQVCGNKICNSLFFTKKSKEYLNKRWSNHIKKEKQPTNKIERYKKAVATRRLSNPDWFTIEQKKKIKTSLLKVINTQEHKDKMIAKFRTPEHREKQSKMLKQLIKEGKFTPPITNTWTHWDSIYLHNNKEHKFRSSWEAAFWSTNKTLSFEILRIPYIYNNKEHTYIVDFIDIKNKIVYEIKPNNKYLSKEKIKEEALKQWCLLNNYTYQLINNDWFYKNYNNIDFNNNEWLRNKMKQFQQCQNIKK